MKRLAKVLARVALTLLLALGILIGGLAVWVKHRYVDTLPDIEPLASATLQGTSGHEAIPCAAMPPHLVQAFVAAEDPSFFEHDAVNAAGILRVITTKLVNPASRLRGASTITQQLAKVMLATTEREPVRHLERQVREVALAFRLESRLTKEQVLCAYLSRIYLGHGARGVVDASAVSFHKTVSQLTLAEMVALAATPRRPSDFFPTADSEVARERRRFVLGRMLDGGIIAKPEHDAAAAELEAATWPPAPATARTGAALALLGTQNPSVVWEHAPRLDGDVDGDGSPDLVFVGHLPAAVLIGVVTGSASAATNSWVLPLQLSAGAQDGIGKSNPSVSFEMPVGAYGAASLCESQPTTESCSAELRLKTALGKAATRGMKGIAISDNASDPFHVYFNPVTRRFEWWRA